MTGEEVFLRGLYELVSGDNQERICLNVFGREYSIQSRAYTFFITHIHANFEHHLSKINLDCFYQNTLFEKSAAAIETKIDCCECSNLVFLPSHIRGKNTCIVFSSNSKSISSGLDAKNSILLHHHDLLTDTQMVL